VASYNVTFAKLYEVTIEAENREKAEDKASVMEDDEIIAKADKEEMIVWNIPYKPYLNIPLN